MPCSATGAEPEFVGVLALAIEDEVAQRLNLGQDQRDALLKLIDARENVDALELAIQVKDLPAAKREEQLAPFRRESERKGLELLSAEQQQKLEQVRMQRAGLATLAEPAIAERLKLDDPQRKQVADLVRQRAEHMAAADKKGAHVVRAEVERNLRALLSDQQWAAWQMLALGPPEPPRVPGDAPAPSKPLEVAVNEPAATKEASPPEATPAEPAKTSDTSETSESAQAAKAADSGQSTPMEPAQPTEAAPAETSEPAKTAETSQSAESAEPAQSQPAAPTGTRPSDPAATETARPAQAEPVEPVEPAAMETPPEPAAPPQPAQPAVPKPEPVPGGMDLAAPSEQPPEPTPGPPSPKPAGGEPAAPSQAESAEMSDAELWKLFQTEMGPDSSRGPVRLRFNFRYQPWEDVLDWVAEQAGLSLLFESMPRGTCNYADDREYTVPEALDVLNSLLLIKGYTLVRRERMLVVVNLEDFKDGIPAELVTRVSVEELDQRGEYELVSTVFQLENITAEEAQKEVEKLTGPQGSIVPVPKAQQLVVTETAGRLRTIRDALRRIEDPEGRATQVLRAFPLDFTLAEEVLSILRQMFGIPADQNAASDGSIRVALDPVGMRLIAFGKPSKLDQVAKVLEALEAPDLGELETAGPEAAPQLEVYNVAPADPQSVLKVAQTLLAGSPGARLSVDEKTGNLIALCRPAEHASIRATVEQLTNDAHSVEVIQLRSLDPQLAVLTITKLFGGGEGSKLKVDADPTTRRLFIQGPISTIEQIRTWLDKMGETELAEAGMATGESVRVVPLSGWAGKSALERLQQIWPAMRTNKIRVITPSAGIPGIRASQRAQGLPSDGVGVDQANPLDQWNQLNQLFEMQRLFSSPSGESWGPQPPPQGPPGFEELFRPEPTGPLPPDGSPPTEAFEPQEKSAGTAPPRASGRSRFVFASDTISAEPEAKAEPEAQAKPDAKAEARPSEAAPGAKGSEAGDSEAQAAASPPGKEPAPIIVAPGPAGIMIASEDLAALQDFEDLLTALGGGALSGTSDLTIFYLVYAENTAVAQTLDQIFGGGTSADRGSTGGSLAQDLAGAAFGDAGALVGSLLGLGGGGTIAPSGSVQIIPTDARLNGLIVRANPTDLETVRQLLEILDQPESPEEVLAQAKPRLIPVYNTQASEIAGVVEEVYQENLSSGSGRGRQPSPMEFLEALRGGRGRGGSSRSSTQVQKMSIGVDQRNNLLVVSAPETLFQEVKALVEQLDQAALGSSSQTMQVVTLKRSNPEKVQEALKSLVGENVTFGGSSSSRSRRSGSRGDDRPSSGSPTDEFRRQMMMRALQGGGMPGGGDGRPSFFGGGGPSRGGFGGGPSRSGFGGGGGGPGGGGPR